MTATRTITINSLNSEVYAMLKFWDSIGLDKKS